MFCHIFLKLNSFLFFFSELCPFSSPSLLHHFVFVHHSSSTVSLSLSLSLCLCVFVFLFGRETRWGLPPFVRLKTWVFPCLYVWSRDMLRSSPFVRLKTWVFPCFTFWSRDTLRCNPFVRLKTWVFPWSLSLCLSWSLSLSLFWVG